MRYRSEVPEAITIALRTEGPMTTTELARATGMHRDWVSAAVGRMKKTLATLPRRVHVAAWRRDSEGLRDYLRPVYGLGDLPDAPRPKPISKAESSKRWREATKAQVRGNFVFNTGMQTRAVLRPEGGRAKNV